ncbi:hypothetical protein TNCV_2285211 [Trichonephila clavipes]|nr:hypothetical protein TNCV_2285211 [Trichonephila clavipes]
MYGNHVMNESSIQKWCIQFKNGQTNVQDEEKKGRPNIVTDELVAKVDEKILENHRFTIVMYLPLVVHPSMHQRELGV